MTQLRLPMPPITITQATLATYGSTWTNNGGRLTRTPPNSSRQLGAVFENAVGQSMANMLGSIQVIPQTSNALIPPISNCVEVGEVLVIGGIRPQNFDVVYRPDGVRFAFDAKTLNDKKSIRKNWQNMVNDLATEATSVHGRFPYAVVAFLVALPSPALLQRQQEAIVETLERLARRVEVNDPVYMAEVISLVVWHPATGLIDPNVPDPASPLRIESFSPLVEAVYLSRYKGLPPHTA